MDVTLSGIDISEDKKQILKNVNITLEVGKIHYLSGDLPIGETLLLNYLAKTFRKPLKSGGNVVCFIESERYLFKELKVKDNLKFYQNLFNICSEHIQKLVKYFSFDKCLNLRVNQLSLNQQQLLYIICSLCNTDAELILLDEPFVDLDLSNQHLVKSYLKKHSNDKVILFTDDYLNDKTFYDFHYQIKGNKLCRLEI